MKKTLSVLLTLVLLLSLAGCGASSKADNAAGMAVPSTPSMSAPMEAPSMPMPAPEIYEEMGFDYAVSAPTAGKTDGKWREITLRRW